MNVETIDGLVIEKNIWYYFEKYCDAHKIPCITELERFIGEKAWIMWSKAQEEEKGERG